MELREVRPIWGGEIFQWFDVPMELPTFKPEHFKISVNGKCKGKSLYAWPHGNSKGFDNAYVKQALNYLISISIVAQSCFQFGIIYFKNCT